MDRPDFIYEKNFQPGHQELLMLLIREIEWDHSMLARKTASFGVAYNYNQMVYPDAPMHPAIAPIVDRLAMKLGYKFNNCLVNYYLDGNSRMGLHSDDIEILAPGTGVSIVSLGSTRTFKFKTKTEPRETAAVIAMEGGSLLHMAPETQIHFLHGIYRNLGAGPRISLTFRNIIKNKPPQPRLPHPSKRSENS